MLDTALGKPVRVLDDEETGPYIMLSRKQLEPVRKLLTDNGIRFWVGHQVVSVDGEPAIVWMWIRQRKPTPATSRPFLMRPPEGKGNGYSR